MRELDQRGSRWAGLALACACSLTLLACRHPEKTPVERGRGIFTRTCAGCHGGDGRGATARGGFSTPPKDLTDPALHARLGSAGIKHTIQVGKGQMPAFGALLAEDDIDALVAFIGSIQREP